VSEAVRYIATVSPVAVTACTIGVFGLVRLWMRLKFNRYVVDEAARQGQPIDAAKIIEITTPGARAPEHSSRDQPAPETNHEVRWDTPDS
jgi:hypothetical protein